MLASASALSCAPKSSNTRSSVSHPRPRAFLSCIAAASAALALTATVTTSRADDEFREIETKYIFGFTIGSGIGLEGEKEFSTETIGAFGKRDGRYAATETKAEFEYTPNQYVQIEVGALVASQNIRSVTNLEDRNQIAFSGAFAELRWLAVERGPSSPFAVTLSVEPTMRRMSEATGERERSFELETRIAADTELIANRLYLGFNLLYEPEWVRTATGEAEREATLGASAALAFRPTPSS